MKSFKFLTIILLTPFCAAFAQIANRSGPIINQNLVGSPALFLYNQSINLESFRFRHGLITQLDVDDSNDPRPFDFLSGSQWLSVGRFTTLNQTLYGLKSQRAGKGLAIQAGGNLP